MHGEGRLCLTQTQRWLGNTMWTKKIDINIGYSTRTRQFSDLLTCCRYLLICMASVVQISNSIQLIRKRVSQHNMYTVHVVCVYVITSIVKIIGKGGV